MTQKHIIEIRGDPLMLHVRQSGTMRCSLARHYHRRPLRTSPSSSSNLAKVLSMSSPIINVISYGLLFIPLIWKRSANSRQAYNLLARETHSLGIIKCTDCCRFILQLLYFETIGRDMYEIEN